MPSTSEAGHDRCVVLSRCSWRVSVHGPSHPFLEGPLMLQSRFVGVVLVAFVACGLVWAQETPKSKAKAAAEKVTGRLPNNYAKLGISEAQRKSIYGIQAKYNEQIDALTKQIEDLRGKRDAEIEAVLTPEQKEKLKALQKDAAAKKSEAKPNGDQ